jgi:hypothetical protein
MYLSANTLKGEIEKRRKTTLFEIVCVICELLHQWGWWANRWIYGNITTSVSNLHDMI